MIAFLKGRLAQKDPAFVIIDCNGVGYLVKISLNTYSSIGKDENIMLYTHLSIKEDSHELYGFSEQDEKKLFQQLISISGVGGNTALTILSSMSPKDLRGVIESEDVKTLQKVKGIGGKTAARIILELKGKLVLTGEQEGGGHFSKVREEAIAALTALGLPKAAIEKKVDAVIKASEGKATVEEIIRQGLKQ